MIYQSNVQAFSSCCRCPESEGIMLQNKKSYPFELKVIWQQSKEVVRARNEL
jgi:hypothetical protein